jgi:hypothetical protein
MRFMHDASPSGSLSGAAVGAMSFVQTAESGGMSKQAMRDEAERLVKEALERKNLVVKQGKTRIEAKCRKCGAPNRVSAEQGETRVGFSCKECGEKQATL